MTSATMIATKTIAMIAAMSVLGTVTSTTAVFAQTDNDETFQSIFIAQEQSAANFASAGNVGDGGDGDTIVAGNNAVAASFQSQGATASNSNEDNDTFDTTE
jgi:hypothetical protein